MSDRPPAETAATTPPKGGDAHAGDHHKFNFEALNNSHNSPYPAIEWIHGTSPQLILNLAGYADINLNSLSAKSGFATAQPAQDILVWATDYHRELLQRKPTDPTELVAFLKSHPSMGHQPLELAQAMTLAQSESMLGAFPRALSFFNHQTFWSTIALVLFAGVLFFARRKPGQHCPANRVQHALEAIVLFVRDEIVSPNLKHGVAAWTPFFASLFFAILACNLFGLFPLFGTATGNIFVTAAFSLVIMLLMIGMGMKENGPGAFWLKLVPVPWSWNPLMMVLWVFLFVMEVAQVFIRPIVLAVRLFANMFAGHTVLLVFVSLGFVIFASDPGASGLTYTLGAFGWLMTLGLYALELLVAFLQAYVFVLLSAVFIGLCAHPEH